MLRQHLYRVCEGGEGGECDDKFGYKKSTGVEGEEKIKIGRMEELAAVLL